MYSLQQGPTEKKIIAQCIRERLPLPDAIQNAPSLLVGLELYYLSFLDLTTCRGQGYGTEGPISWITINQFCQVNGIIGEQREDVFFLIQRMDAAYLEFKAKKLQSQMNNR